MGIKRRGFQIEFAYLPNFGVKHTRQLCGSLKRIRACCVVLVLRISCAFIPTGRHPGRQRPLTSSLQGLGAARVWLFRRAADTHGSGGKSPAPFPPLFPPPGRHPIIARFGSGVVSVLFCHQNDQGKSISGSVQNWQWLSLLWRQHAPLPQNGSERAGNGHYHHTAAPPPAYQNLDPPPKLLLQIVLLLVLLMMFQ